jgi:23S rRNA pseudouridine1911/1915/1917 synthase
MRTGDSWEVPGALDGERVDRALALLTGLSRREVNQLLDGASVVVSGRVVASRSRRVRAGEKVSIDPRVGFDEPAAPLADPQVDVAVVWSDQDLVVVDKPAGLVVHPGAGNQTGTLVHGLLARFPDLRDLAQTPGATGDERQRPGIVQRLDKGTSGLLVVARTAAARSGLVEQLSRRQVDREYTALVGGTVEADAGLIDAPLGRGDRDPTRITVQAGGRAARTRYQVEDRWDRPVPSTLLRCHLETGRTHQIRVHLSSIGHPVVGDDRYGHELTGRWRPLPAGRVFLHAGALAFEHPVRGGRLSFSSPLPVDLTQVLAGMPRMGPTGTKRSEGEDSPVQSEIGPSSGPNRDS